MWPTVMKSFNPWVCSFANPKPDAIGAWFSNMVSHFPSDRLNTQVWQFPVPPQSKLLA
jgi:hypothetical protein